jgi:hypothetical protein
MDLLDELYAEGLSELFLGISLAAAKKFEVKIEIAHLDSTSLHVDGTYGSPEPGVIETQRLRCGRFILASNVLDSSQLSADDAFPSLGSKPNVKVTATRSS